jgi:hypothetical protein
MRSLHKMQKFGEERGRSCLPVGCIASEISQRTSINFNIRTVCTKCISDDLLWFEWVIHNPALHENNFMSQGPS